MTSSPITDEMIARIEAEIEFQEIRNDPPGTFATVRISDLRTLLAMRSSASPVVGMEEMVERAVEWRLSKSINDHIRLCGNPLSPELGEKWRADIRADVVGLFEASGLLSTPLVTGRE
jgi:hypothetical protein